MKRKFLYIFTAIVISFTSMGFGFLESSTAVHRQANRSSKTDSVSIHTINVSLKHSSIPQKEIQKPAHNSITETVIQWLANAVRNAVEKIVIYLTNVLQSIITNLIDFFTK